MGASTTLPKLYICTSKVTVPWPTDWVPDKWLGHSQFFQRVLALPFIPIRYVRMAWARRQTSLTFMVSMISLPTLKAHGWVVNLLQPSGMCIQRRALERTIILKGGTARSKKLLVRITWTVLRPYSLRKNRLQQKLKLGSWLESRQLHHHRLSNSS